MKKIILIALAILLITGIGIIVFVEQLSSPTGKSIVNEKAITIGYFGPMSGPVSDIGNNVYNSFKLAHGLNSKGVKIIYEDGKCDSNEAVNAALKLININRVKILVSGVCSSSTLAVAPIAQANNILLISPVAASPEITNAGENIFRISSSSKIMAEETAKKLIEKNITRVSILYELNDYPFGWKKDFIPAFKLLGGNVILVESFESGSKDLRTQLSKIKNQEQDAVLFIALSSVSSNLMLKQSHELNMKDQIVGNEAFSFKSVLQQNKDIVNNLLVLTFDYDINSIEMRKYLLEYNKRYGKLVDEEIYGALGYDTYMILQDSLDYCGEDIKCLKAYLGNVKRYNGASGVFSLDANGDGVRSFVLRNVVNGVVT